MSLNTLKIKALEPKSKRYSASDGRGLALEIQPSGLMSWRFRYRMHGKAAKINLGRYPQVSLAQARSRREEFAKAISAGESPAEQKRKKLAEALASVTVREFAERYYSEVVQKKRKDPLSVRRYLLRDIYPSIGKLPLGKVNAQDLQAIIFKRRDGGRQYAALAIRNLLKRIWDYAIICGAAKENPAKSTPAAFIATAKARTRRLSEVEIRVFLRALDSAKIEDRYKIAFQLILLNLIRKSELRKAAWRDIDFERREWVIPEDNAKNKRELLIHLSRQSVELFRKLWNLGQSSELVLPMEKSRTQPLAASTLNRILAQVKTGLPHFTIHDLRRTASTRLNEMEFNELWIEKALNHTKQGVSGVYNRAEYAKQRREMLQSWADYVDSLRGLTVKD